MYFRYNKKFKKIATLLGKTAIDDPVNSDLIKTFQVLTEEDIESDPSWKTAPVVVCSNDERYSLNAIIVKNYATEKGVPVLTWLKDISNTQKFNADVCNILYDSMHSVHMIVSLLLFPPHICMRLDQQRSINFYNTGVFRTMTTLFAHLWKLKLRGVHLNRFPNF